MRGSSRSTLDQAHPCFEMESADGLDVSVFHAKAKPVLWGAYLDGLCEAYGRYGVGQIVHRPTLAEDPTVRTVFVVLDGGLPVAGLRAHGPLTEPDQAAALTEMATAGAADKLGERIAEWLTEGAVIETKGLWRVENHPRGKDLAACMSRCSPWALEVLDAERALCTGPIHTRSLYEATGAEVLVEMGSAAYPDRRYQTAAMCWRRGRIPPDDLQACLLSEERGRLSGQSSIADASARRK